VHAVVAMRFVDTVTVSNVAEAANNQSVTNKAIRTLAIQGLEYLDTRTEFWQQQKPMYSRRRDKKMRENANRQVAADADKCKDPTQWVLKNLEDIDDGMSTYPLWMAKAVRRLVVVVITSAYGARPVLVSRASRSAREIRRRRVLCRCAVSLSAEKSCLPARPRLLAGERALGA